MSTIKSPGGDTGILTKLQTCYAMTEPENGNGRIGLYAWALKSANVLFVAQTTNVSTVWSLKKGLKGIWLPGTNILGTERNFALSYRQVVPSVFVPFFLSSGKRQNVDVA